MFWKKKKRNSLVSFSSSVLQSWGAPVSGAFASWSSQFHFQDPSLFKIPARSCFRPVMGNPLLSLQRLDIFKKSRCILLTQFTQVLAFSVVARRCMALVFSKRYGSLGCTWTCAFVICWLLSLDTPPANYSPPPGSEARRPKQGGLCRWARTAGSSASQFGSSLSSLISFSAVWISSRVVWRLKQG